MSEVDTARAYKDKLWARYKEVKEAIKTIRDPRERCQQEHRAKTLFTMYQEACHEVARLEGRRSQAKPRDIHMDGLFTCPEVWSDIEGMTWGKADGMAWEDIMAAREPGAATARQNRLLTQLLNDGLAACTDCQREYIIEYYMHEKVMDEIAQERGVHKSAVSRGITRGLAQVAHNVVARLTIASCVTDEGLFDYVEFARRTSVLTERQMEVMYLLLTKDVTLESVGKWLGRDKSVVWHTKEKVERRLKAVKVDFIPGKNVREIKASDWSHLTETELAEQLGLSPWYFYEYLHCGERIHGFSLLHYYILCLLRQGMTVQAAAAKAGVSERAAKDMARCLDSAIMDGDPLDLSLLPAYHPQKVERAGRSGNVVLAALRDLTRAEDAIIDQITPEVLGKIERRGAVYVGA